MLINSLAYSVSHGWSGLFTCEVKGNKYEFKWKKYKKIQFEASFKHRTTTTSQLLPSRLTRRAPWCKSKCTLRYRYFCQTTFDRLDCASTSSLTIQRQDLVARIPVCFQQTFQKMLEMVSYSGKFSIFGLQESVSLQYLGQVTWIICSSIFTTSSLRSLISFKQQSFLRPLLIADQSTCAIHMTRNRTVNGLGLERDP